MHNRRKHVPCLGVLLLHLPLWGQSTLLIRPTEGEGATYSLGSRATRGVSVEITDEMGRPIEGAVVAFKLPDQGPTGTFASGGHTEIITTKADGVASIWGMQWNRIAGELAVRITAAKGGAKAGTLVTQYLSASVELPSAPKRQGSVVGGTSHKWLWITLASAGGIGAAVAATGLVAKPEAPPTATPTVRIGTPTITLGKP